jgi:hypothetical protein
VPGTFWKNSGWCSWQGKIERDGNLGTWISLSHEVTHVDTHVGVRVSGTLGATKHCITDTHGVTNVTMGSVSHGKGWCWCWGTIGRCHRYLQSSWEMSLGTRQVLFYVYLAVYLGCKWPASESHWEMGQGAGRAGVVGRLRLELWVLSPLPAACPGPLTQPLSL